MSPRTAGPLPKQERSIATRQRLLDAAVDELLESGFAGTTTVAVAQRAGVSRGAQQHHFAQKDTLISAAIVHLADRLNGQLRERVASAPEGSQRTERYLDAVFDNYGGPLFAAMLELSLAARRDTRLRAQVDAQERLISRAVQTSAAELLGERVIGQDEFARRWALALGATRGVAILRLLGHPASAVEAQWQAVRPYLVDLLTDAS